MKYFYFVISFFVFAWISHAQTNVNTNGVNALLALVTTNPPAPSPLNGLMPTRGPIKIEAAGPAVFDINGHWVTYSDNVRVTDAQMKLTCEWLEHNLPQNGETITNIIARTNVVIDFTPKNGEKAHGTGDKAVYFFHVQNGVTNQTITLTGNPPMVQQGQTFLSGTNIVYDMVSGHVTANGPITGAFYPTNSPAGTNLTTAKTNQPAQTNSH